MKNKKFPRQKSRSSRKRSGKIILLAQILCSVIFLLFVDKILAKEEWKDRRSQHFIVYFKEDTLGDFADEVLEEAEEYYVEITQNLGLVRFKFWLWENRAKFYIYNDLDDYVNNTNQPAWSSGAVDYRQKVIKTYPQASGFFDSTMPHELGHIIFREFIGMGTKIPLWFEEGIASYQEKSKRLTADRIVREAQNEGRFITLSDLSRMNLRNTDDNKAVALFYAEATSVVNFLITKFGRGTFSWFCRDLRDGKDFESSLWRFNSRDIETLNKKWVQYLEER